MPAGYTSGRNSILDRITRTCKNAAGDVVAIQVITVVVKPLDPVNAAGMSYVTPESISTDRFKRGARVSLQTDLTLKSGASRVIATVETTGSFDSRTESGGDITTVTYEGIPPVNDIIVPVSTLDGVFKVGDSV